LYSQSLISPILKPENLSTRDSAFIEYAESLPHKGIIKYIKFNGLDENGDVRIIISEINNGQEMIFKINNTVFENEKKYVYTAKNQQGSVTIYVTPDGINGTIDLLTRKFLLLPLGEKNGIIIEIDLTIEDNLKCPVIPENNITKQIGYCDSDCGTAVVEVLLLSIQSKFDDPKGKNLFNSNKVLVPRYYIGNTFLDLNIHMLNSGIKNKTFNVSYRDYEPDFVFSRNNDSYKKLDEDVSSFYSSSNRKKLTDEVQADITVLLVNIDYGTYIGGSKNTEPIDIDKVSLVNLSFIDNSRYTLMHEIGHHFGCHHNDEDPNCPNGYSIPIISGISTRNSIMANTNLSFSRFPSFSNPDIIIGGFPSGIKDKADNAQQIRGSFCNVSKSYPCNRSLIIDIIPYGSTIICKGRDIEFDADVKPGRCNCIPCGFGPYTYEWYWSSDLVNWIPINTTLSFIFQKFIKPTYLKVVVTSADGKKNSKVKSFIPIDCLKGDDSEIRSSEMNTSSPIFRLYPNPSSNELTLSHIGNKIDDIKCFDAVGIEKQIIIESLDLFNSKIKVDNFNKGIYFLRINTDKKEETLKFIIN
jgi:hypothetical protein